MTIRVLVVEDHPIVVSGLAGLLAGNPGTEIVGQAPTLAEARRQLPAVRPDVVLLDLRLPDGLGFELLEEAASADDSPGFLVLSTFTNPEYVSAALNLGASGYLLKTAGSDEIIAAIRTVAEGRLAFTADQLRVARTTGWTPLTQRERDLLEGLATGRSNEELATALGCSGRTVEKHLARLFARFDVTSRTELAVAAERSGALDLPTRERRPGRPPGKG